MPAKDLGTKHTCFKCGTKFYDLKKTPPLCPKCGADQRESPALKPTPPSERRQRAARPVVREEVATETELEEELADEDAEDEAAEEDEDEP